MSLSLCVTLLSSGITAGAESIPKLWVSSASAKAGEQVNVKIMASGFSNVSGIQLKVSFGSELQLVNQESDYITFTSANYIVSNGVFAFVEAGKQSESDQNKLESIIPDDNEAVLMTLAFKIPNGAAENTVYKVVFDSSFTYGSDTDEKKIVFSMKDGKVTVEPEEPMTVELIMINADDSQVIDTQLFYSNTADYSYTFDSAVSGSYILRASRPKYVTREYNITVNGTQIQQLVEIYLPGDVNCNGTVNIIDLQRLYAHLNGSNPLGESLSYGDVNGNGTVDIIDLQRLYAHLNGSNLLF